MQTNKQKNPIKQKKSIKDREILENCSNPSFVTDRSERCEWFAGQVRSSLRTSYLCFRWGVAQYVQVRLSRSTRKNPYRVQEIKLRDVVYKKNRFIMAVHSPMLRAMYNSCASFDLHLCHGGGKTHVPRRKNWLKKENVRTGPGGSHRNHLGLQVLWGCDFSTAEVIMYIKKCKD